MKKLALVTFSLLLISTIGLIFNIPLIKAHPETIYVDDDNITGPWNGTPEHPYQNITSGLAHASPDDTIYVYNGTYYEKLTIDKPLSLTGENKFTTIIDGNNTENVIKITANNVNITHFTIRNSLLAYAFSGVYANHSSGNNINYNIIINNWDGIRLEHSSDNTLTYNNLSNNMEAIYLINSSNNILTNNKILNNDFGIVLRNSNNSTAFHNNFINNSWKSISSIDSTNTWDNGVEGNYWSDYKGNDTNRDGIGDSPYIINANNTDNHPLMGIFSDFTVIYEKETHHVLTVCNSTISQFQFNETLRMLNFNVTGVNNTTGFCRIMIPEQLTHKPHIVLINDEQVNATSLPISNTTQSFLYFAYNHTTREVKILSKPYYELLEKYITLLEDYKTLNSTLHQLLTDYDLLNQTYQQLLANHTQLLADYNALNQTYWQVFANYTQLQADHDLLNQTYQNVLANYTELLTDYNNLNKTYEQVLSNYTQLQTNYHILNQTYQETLANYTRLQNEYDLLNTTYTQTAVNYTELLAKHHSLNQTYQELMANNTKLQNDYNFIQTDHNNLLEQYNSLNSTYNKTESEYTNTRITLWCISVAAAAITVMTSSLTIKYHGRTKEQEKLLKKYKSELERISLLDIARTQFETDVQRRGEKIEKFKTKYDITVRPHNTLDDVIRSLELKKKKED